MIGHKCRGKAARDAEVFVDLVMVVVVDVDFDGDGDVDLAGARGRRHRATAAADGRYSRMLSFQRLDVYQRASVNAWAGQVHVAVAVKVHVHDHDHAHADVEGGPEGGIS